MMKRSKRVLGVFIATVFIWLFLIKGVSAGNDQRAYGWGFKPGEPGKGPEVGELYEALIARHNAYYMDNTTSKKLYLTFDAGYEYGYTPQILDILKKHKIPATFFLVGDYLRKEEELVKRMVKDGHIIGNHTWAHKDLTKLSKEQYLEELVKFEDYYKKLTGKELLKIVRPPEGTFSERSLAIADELGYYTIFWSVAYKDWDIRRQRGWEYAYNNVMRQLHPGAIILLHSVSKDNADALEKIIVDAKAEGYEFAPLTEMFIPKELFVAVFKTGRYG